MLALCSKTTACTLPAALLLVLWWQRRPISWQRWAQILPFVLLGLAMGLLTVWWERNHQGTHGRLFSLGLADRILVASHAIWFYAAKLAWPAQLSFSYPRWTLDPANPLAYGWLVAGAGLWVAVCFLRRFVGRGIEVAGLFYVATLSPVIGFIMLYTFRYTYVADHYQYAACIGPLALVAAGMVRVWAFLGKKKPWAGPLFCGILLTGLGVLTWRQSEIYQSSETL